MGLPYGAAAGASFTMNPDGTANWTVPDNNGRMLNQAMTDWYNNYLDGQNLTDPLARQDWFRMQGLQPYDPSTSSPAPATGDAPMPDMSGQPTSYGGQPGWLAALGGIGAAPTLEHTIPTGLGYNPQLQSQIDQLKTQYMTGLQRDALPMVNRASILAGGYGGAKNGVAEGIATGDAMRGFASAATNLLGSDWEAQQGRDLSKYGMDQNFYLGNQGQMLNFASDQRNQDRADLVTGANLYDQGTSGYWKPIDAANRVYGNYTGFGSSTNSSSAGGGWLGGAGGAGAGWQLASGWRY